MALLFRDIMTADLSELEDAATAWRKMSERFGTLHSNYQSRVSGPLVGSAWEGLAFFSYGEVATVSAGEFDGAKQQAEGISKLLKDAFKDLSEKQQHLRSQVNQAKENHLSVDGDGAVSFDTSSLDEGSYAGYRNDPSYQASVTESVREWQKAIDEAVRAVNDADAGVKLALKAAVEPPDNTRAGKHGFNDDVVTDVEKVEGERATELATKLNSGKDLSPSESTELQRLMRDNSEDRAYARTLLNGLGEPNELLKLHDRLAQSAADGNSRYGAVDKDLSQVLATAFPGRPGPGGKSPYREGSWAYEYLKDLKKSGRHNFGDKTDVDYGYQRIAGLMESGGNYKNSDYLVQTLADDVIDFEKDEGSGIWAVRYGLEPGSSADPLDSLLGVMADDPQTATQFLDPKGNENLAYLMRERDWPGGGHTSIMDTTPTEDLPDYAGFGDALNAATTDQRDESAGDAAAHDRVLYDAVDHSAAEGDDFPTRMREPLAQAMANQSVDTHAYMSDQRPPDLGDGEVSEWKKHRVNLMDAATQVSRSQEAYGILNEGMNFGMVHDIHTENGDPDQSLLRTGNTLGFLEQARYEAIADIQGEQSAEAAWGKAWMYHGGGAVVTGIPYAGDTIQRGVDLVTLAWQEGEQARIDDTATDENYKAYEARQIQADALAEQWLDANRDWAGRPENNEYIDSDGGSSSTRNQLESLTNNGGDSAKRLTGAGN